MYMGLLHTHGMLRWIVLALALAMIALCAHGLIKGEAWTPRHRKLSAALLGTTHLQVLLGLLLYVGVSPLMKSILSNFGGAMKNPVLRFWAVEHITVMILGAISIHVGHVMAKRAQADAARFKRALVGVGLGLLLIVAGIPWPFRDGLGRALFPS